MAKQNTPPNELTPEENLQAENEINALNLELNYGAKMHISGDAPPELIQQFLANVQQFENQHRSGAKTTVYQRIGSPPFATPDLLDKTTLSDEIVRLLQILEEKGFVILRPDDLPDFDFYEFLITDIFQHEVDDIQIPGMITCLDYAEFHQSENLLIALKVEIFLLELLNLNVPFSGEFLSETCRDDHNAINRAQALQIITDFRNQYLSIIPVAFRPEELIQPGNGTYQTFGIRWEGIPKSGEKKEKYEGMGIIQVELEHGEWLVQGVNMPGFRF